MITKIDNRKIYGRLLLSRICESFSLNPTELSVHMVHSTVADITQASGMNSSSQHPSVASSISYSEIPAMVPPWARETAQTRQSDMHSSGLIYCSNFNTVIYSTSDLVDTRKLHTSVYIFLSSYCFRLAENSYGLCDVVAMLHHPETMRKAQVEIDAESLPYVRAIVNETMRYFESFIQVLNLWPEFRFDRLQMVSSCSRWCCT